MGRDSFDLITVDQVLPDGHGLDLLRAIRREGIQTPVIMVAGSDDPASITRALRAGAVDFVVQDPALTFLVELPERVSKALGRSASD